MNKFAKAGLAGLLSLSLSGCSTMTMSLAEMQRRPILNERTITQNEKQEEIRTVVDERSAIVSAYSMTQIDPTKQRAPLEWAFNVKKSEKEEITRTVDYAIKTKEVTYNELNDLKTGNTLRKTILGSKEGKTILERKIEKEELSVKENENAAGTQMGIYFPEPAGPMSIEGLVTDAEGMAYIEISCIEEKKKDKHIFFDSATTRDHLESQLTGEGKKHYNLFKIVSSSDRQSMSQDFFMYAIEEGKQLSKTRMNRNVWRVNLGSLYGMFKAGIVSELEEYISPVKVTFEVLDEETRRPIDDIAVKMIPIRSLTAQDIEEKELEIRKKYFKEGSDLFYGAKASYGQDVKLPQDGNVPVVYNGALNISVPKNSAYRLEFIDSAGEPRYKAFVKELKFAEDENAEILLEKIATDRVRFDDRNSRGSYHRK
jgi:hypothetical protein